MMTLGVHEAGIMRQQLTCFQQVHEDMHSKHVTGAHLH